MTEAPERILVTEDVDKPGYKDTPYVRADLVDWISVEEELPEDTGYFEIWLSPLWDNLSPRLDTATWVGNWSKEFAGYEITHWRRVRGPE